MKHTYTRILRGIILLTVITATLLTMVSCGKKVTAVVNDNHTYFGVNSYDYGTQFVISFSGDKVSACDVTIPFKDKEEAKEFLVENTYDNIKINGNEFSYEYTKNSIKKNIEDETNESELDKLLEAYKNYSIDRNPTSDGMIVTVTRGSAESEYKYDKDNKLTAAKYKIISEDYAKVYYAKFIEFKNAKIKGTKIVYSMPKETIDVCFEGMTEAMVRMTLNEGDFTVTE